MTLPPTHNSPPTAQRPRKGGNGCLRGCLIATLVVLLLLVGGTVLALTAGRTYVVRHLPEWESRYPLLALGIDLLDVRQQLAPQGSARPTGGRQTGSADKALLPADVAVHPSPRAETYNIGPDQVTAFQRIAASPADVATYWREAMAGHGWSPHDDQEVDGALILLWEKGRRVCRLEVVAAGHATEAWLRCSARP